MTAEWMENEDGGPRPAGQAPSAATALRTNPLPVL